MRSPGRDKAHKDSKVIHHTECAEGKFLFLFNVALGKVKDK